MQSTVSGSGNTAGRHPAEPRLQDGRSREHIYVTQGEHVTAGQLLAELDPQSAEVDARTGQGHPPACRSLARRSSRKAAAETTSRRPAARLPPRQRRHRRPGRRERPARGPPRAGRQRGAYEPAASSPRRSYRPRRGPPPRPPRRRDRARTRRGARASTTRSSSTPSTAPTSSGTTGSGTTGSGSTGSGSGGSGRSTRNRDQRLERLGRRTEPGDARSEPGLGAGERQERHSSPCRAPNRRSGHQALRARERHDGLAARRSRRNRLRGRHQQRELLEHSSPGRRPRAPRAAPAPVHAPPVGGRLVDFLGLAPGRARAARSRCSATSSMQLVVSLSEAEIGQVARRPAGHRDLRSPRRSQARGARRRASRCSPTSSAVTSYDVTSSSTRPRRMKPGMSASAEVVVNQAEGVNVPTQRDHRRSRDRRARRQGRAPA